MGIKVVRKYVGKIEPWCAMEYKGQFYQHLMQADFVRADPKSAKWQDLTVFLRFWDPRMFE